MRNVLNVGYRYVDKQQIKHVALSLQVKVSFIFFYRGSAAGYLS